MPPRPGNRQSGERHQLSNLNSGSMAVDAGFSSSESNNVSVKMRVAALNYAVDEKPTRVKLGPPPKKETVRKTSTASSSGASVNGIEVANVEVKHQELVRLFFMDFGCIDSFQYLPHDKMLLLRFCDAHAAQVVLQKTTHEIIGDSLQVAVAPLMSDVVLEEDTIGAHESATVLVTGIPPDVHEKHVLLYFKTAAVSGGGEVSSLFYVPGSGTAQITFACSSVARRVCAAGKHRINKTTLSVTPLYGQQNTDLEDLMHIYENDYRASAILVENIPSCVIEDHLRLYFRDCEHSGGGPIKMIYYNRRSGVAIIVFHDTEAAKRSTATRTHRLSGHTVHVELLQNEARCTEQVLYFSGFVDFKETFESLWWWLSAAAGVPPQALQFNADRSAVVAFFKSYVVHNVIPFSCFYGLSGRLLEVKRVPQTTKLLISNIPEGISSRMLKYYLEHPANGGTATCVKDIQFMNDKKYKVFLKSSDVLRSIMEEDRVMNDHVLKMLPFYEQFGETSEHQQFRSQDGPTCAMVAGSGIIRPSEQRNLFQGGVARSVKFRQQRLTSDVKRNMLLVRNVINIQDDHLLYFLWALSGVPVVEMRKITDDSNKSCTLVKFARSLAFTDDGALPWLPANFGGAPLDVVLVHRPRCTHARHMPAEGTEEYTRMLLTKNGVEMLGSTGAPKFFAMETSFSQAKGIKEARDVQLDIPRMKVAAINEKPLTSNRIQNAADGLYSKNQITNDRLEQTMVEIELRSQLDETRTMLKDSMDLARTRHETIENLQHELKTLREQLEEVSEERDRLQLITMRLRHNAPTVYRMGALGSDAAVESFVPTASSLPAAFTQSLRLKVVRDKGSLFGRIGLRESAVHTTTSIRLPPSTPHPSFCVGPPITYHCPYCDTMHPDQDSVFVHEKDCPKRPFDD